MESAFTGDRSVTAERYFTQSSVLTMDGICLRPLKEFVEHRRGFSDKPLNSSSPPFIPLSTPGSENTASCQVGDGSTYTEQDLRTHLVGRKKSIELNKLLAESPHEVDSWLELVRCQVSEVGSDSLSQGSTPEKLASAIADIQTAVLDRALEKNPASVELKLAQLEVCHGRWEVEKLAAEWKSVVFQHAGDPHVWKRYLRYVRSTFRTFSTGRVTAAYVRAISTLRGARDGTLLSHKAPPLVTSHIIGKFSGCGAFTWLLLLKSVVSTRAERITFC